jgi:hypothetical protein
MMLNARPRGYVWDMVIGNRFEIKFEVLGRDGKSVDLTTETATWNPVGKIKRDFQHDDNHFETQELTCSWFIDNGKTYVIAFLDDTSMFRNFGRVVFDIDAVQDGTNIHQRLSHGFITLQGGAV